MSINFCIMLPASYRVRIFLPFQDIHTTFAHVASITHQTLEVFIYSLLNCCCTAKSSSVRFELCRAWGAVFSALQIVSRNHQTPSMATASHNRPRTVPAPRRYHCCLISDKRPGSSPYKYQFCRHNRDRDESSFMACSVIFFARVSRNKVLRISESWRASGCSARSGKTSRNVLPKVVRTDIR